MKTNKKKLIFLIFIFSLFFFIEEKIVAQWFKHQLHVAGKDGLIDLSDQLPDESNSIIHIEINGWNCEFELFSLESYRLVKKPTEREVVQAQEWIMATCHPINSPFHQVKFSTSCQNLDGPLEGEWDKKKLKDSISIILKNEYDFVNVSLSCG